MRKQKSKFLKHFKNKLVTITVKDVRMKNNNMSFIGVLLDEDKEYLFLGEEEGGPISAAIPKSQNAGVTLMNELDLLEEIIIPPDQEVQ